LIFSSQRTGRILAVLLLGVCVAASRLGATDSSTPNNGQKPAPPKTTSPAHPAATHAAAQKTAAPTAASHTVVNKTTTAPAAAKPNTASAPRPATASTPHRATTHTVASTSAHRTTATHPTRTAYRSRPRPLTYSQRLARLHPQPERIQEIQQALIREGYLQGDPSGQWDARTHDAMVRYQTDHGFPATGLPEAKSLMKLGLGSHPLPAELDHGPVPGATPTQTVFTVTPMPPSAGSSATPSQESVPKQ
jgi:hypothetical protein